VQAYDRSTFRIIIQNMQDEGFKLT
jgi:Ca2+-dependent lipid-binding protein